MNKTLAVLVLLTLALAHGCCPAYTVHPATSTVLDYTSISEAVCTYISENEDYRRGPVVVISKTVPLIDIFLLRSVYLPDTADLQAAEEDDALSQELKEHHSVKEITFAVLDSPCNFELVEKAVPSDDGQKLLLEYSDLVQNPFAGETDPRVGFFAKLRLQGQFAGDWYWIEAIQAESYFLAGKVIRLPIEDG